MNKTIAPAPAARPVLASELRVEVIIIIIGSGAGGVTLAHCLAPTGKRILVLERGDWLPREIENWDSMAVFGKARYSAKGILVAFAADLFISFLILFSLLQVFHQPSLKSWIGVIAGLYLWAFVAEAPLSGMSLNPARSLASAIPARDFEGLWIYFVAPPWAMLLAAQVCRWWIDS